MIDAVGFFLKSFAVAFGILTTFLGCLLLSVMLLASMIMVIL